MTLDPQIIPADAAAVVGDNTQIILHCCSTLGWPDSDFAARLGARWPDPEVRFRTWQHDGGDFEVGRFRLVDNGATEPQVANVLVADESGEVTEKGWRGLERLADSAHSLQATVHVQTEQLVDSQPGPTLARIRATFESRGAAVCLYRLPRRP